MLTYNQVVDACDEYCRIGQKHFTWMSQVLCENDQGSFWTQILEAIEMNRFGETNESECK